MEILYTDRRIVVCLKPVGVCSADEPGGMPVLLRDALGLGKDGCIRTVHRLDRPVGGVMVYARSRAAASVLSGQLRLGRMKKEYLAVLQGSLPHASGELRDWLVRDHAAHRTLVAPGPSKDAREAVLLYRLLEEKDGLSLVHIALRTGRTHQIRAQVSAREHPIAGDRKYGSTMECPIALWSCSVSFEHPQTGEAMDFFRFPPGVFPWSEFSPGALERAQRERFEKSE